MLLVSTRSKATLIRFQVGTYIVYFGLALLNFSLYVTAIFFLVCILVLQLTHFLVNIVNIALCPFVFLYPLVHVLFNLANLYFL